MTRSLLLACGLLGLWQATAIAQPGGRLPGADWGGVVGNPQDDPAPIMAPVFVPDHDPAPVAPVAPAPNVADPVPGGATPMANPLVRRPNPVSPPVGYVPATPLPRSAQNVMDLYSGATSQRVLAQLEERPSSGRQTSTSGAIAPPRPRSAGKPFQGVSASPTVSPYLNLFREEISTELPNYYTFVRPMQEQLQTNRSQQQELTRLQRQVQSMPYGSPSSGMRSTGRLPDTGHGTRYFNTSGYFPAGRSMR